MLARVDWLTPARPAIQPNPNAGQISHFAVRVSSAMSPEETERLRQTLEKTHVLFYEAMGRAGFELEPHPEPLVWMVFADRQEYDRYTWQAEGIELPELDGYYSPRTNRVTILFCKPSAADRQARESRAPRSAEQGAMPLKPPNGYMGEPPAASPEREAHEAAHQLAFNTGVQKRGVMYPFWVAEGLATGFEPRSPLGPGAINLMRCRHLLSARRRGSLEPLPEFLVRVQVGLENNPAVQESYGQAWGVFHYLFTRHPTRLRRYLRQLATSPLGRQPLHVRQEHVASALGPMDELEAGWQAFLNGLDADSRDRGTVSARPPLSGTPTPLDAPGR